MLVVTIAAETGLEVIGEMEMVVVEATIWVVGDGFVLVVMVAVASVVVASVKAGWARAVVGKVAMEVEVEVALSHPPSLAGIKLEVMGLGVVA